MATTPVPTTLPPTTIAPTTLAPTTLATTVVPTTTLTTLAPTTVLDVDIDALPIEIVIGVRAYRSDYPGWGRDETRDTWYDVDPIEITLGVEGEWQDQTFNVDPIDIVISQEGDPIVVGQVINLTPIEIVISIPTAPIVLTNDKCGWVAWSRIGSLDFDLDRDNVAGKRPMEWFGCVFDILKLDKSVVVYGANGVSFLTPTELAMGLKNIHPLGLICKGAVAGNEFVHYFIDVKSKLYKLSTEGLRLLDYSEFLSQMTDPQLRLDSETGLLYICDGTYGYVYSTLFESFGAGPASISGIGSKNGTLYVSSPGIISTPKFDICTDIYDMGTRKPKTIQYVEVGTDLTHNLQLMIETRVSNKSTFIKTPWALVNPSGIAYLPCFGLEFKFHLRSYIYEYIELDYLRITGVIHGFQYLDSVGQTYRTE